MNEHPVHKPLRYIVTDGLLTAAVTICFPVHVFWYRLGRRLERR